MYFSCSFVPWRKRWSRSSRRGRCMSASHTADLSSCSRSAESFRLRSDTACAVLPASFVGCWAWYTSCGSERPTCSLIAVPFSALLYPCWHLGSCCSALAAGLGISPVRPRRALAPYWSPEGPSAGAPFSSSLQAFFAGSASLFLLSAFGLGHGPHILVRLGVWAGGDIGGCGSCVWAASACAPAPCLHAYSCLRVPDLDLTRLRQRLLAVARCGSGGIGSGSWLGDGWRARASDGALLTAAPARRDFTCAAAADRKYSRPVCLPTLGGEALLGYSCTPPRCRIQY